MRLLRVSRLKVNSVGGSDVNRFTVSKYAWLSAAAFWNNSTTGRRASSYSVNAHSTSGNWSSALASAMASSIASFVPDPIQKCAVCAESPSSTTFPACHAAHFSVAKPIHFELFGSSRQPCNTSAKSRSH